MSGVRNTRPFSCYEPTQRPQEPADWSANWGSICNLCNITMFVEMLRRCESSGLSIADLLKNLDNLGSTTDLDDPPMAQRPRDHSQPHNVTPLDETYGESHSQQVGNTPAVHQDMNSSPSDLQRYPGSSSLDNLEVECEAKFVGGTSGSLELPDVVEQKKSWTVTVASQTENTTSIYPVSSESHPNSQQGVDPCAQSIIFGGWPLPDL